MSCTRSQEFLAQAKIEINERVDARKNPLDADATLQLLQQVDEVYAAKGKSVVHHKLSDKSSRESALSTILGPTGNLRAPSILRGRTLFVGFNPELYERIRFE